MDDGTGWGLLWMGNLTNNWEEISGWVCESTGEDMTYRWGLLSDCDTLSLVAKDFFIDLVWEALMGDTWWWDSMEVGFCWN